MSGIIGLPEGINQRAGAEHNQQDTQVHAREIAAVELKEKQIRRQREVGKSHKSDSSKIRDRAGGNQQRRQKSGDSPGKDDPASPEDPAQTHIIDITV